MAWCIHECDGCGKRICPGGAITYCAVCNSDKKQDETDDFWARLRAKKEQAEKPTPACQQPENDGDCCCNCCWHAPDYSHPCTDGGSILRRRGWICMAPSFAAENESGWHPFSGWSEHGLCEMHSLKRDSEWREFQRERRFGPVTCLPEAEVAALREYATDGAKWRALPEVVDWDTAVSDFLDREPGAGRSWAALKDYLRRRYELRPLPIPEKPKPLSGRLREWWLSEMPAPDGALEALLAEVEALERAQAGG